MIKALNLKKSLAGVSVFNGLSITVEDGEVVGVIGSSGSGKSLLLRELMMIDCPDSGQIFLNSSELTKPGADLIAARKDIGLVFQSFNLFSHLTVVENVLSGLIHLQKIDPETALAKAMELLQTVGLKDKAYYYPRQLSGGQKQRAAIARTLAMEPDTILLDEPTSALDPNMKGEVESVIKYMAQTGHTMVIASHEMGLLKAVCTRVVFLHDGIIYEEGTPEELLNNPQKDATRRFIRALRILEFDIESKSYDFIGIQTDISRFASRNSIPAALCVRLNSVMEELCQMVMLYPKTENRLLASFEYDPKDESLTGTVYFSGEPFDPDDPLYVFSWPIIKLRTSSASYEPANKEGYTNLISLVMK